MTKDQKTFLDSLTDSEGNIKEALKTSGISNSQLKDFRNDEKFEDEYNAIIDVLADQSMVDLVKNGHPQATIEYKRMQKSRLDLDEAQFIKYETMELLIIKCDTKTEAIKHFCSIFKMSATGSEKVYTKILRERNLLSPHQRKKQEEEETANQLVEKFKSGKLGEVEMYRRLMEIHLRDAESAEYPSERQRATTQVIEIQRRLEEIEEREKAKERKQDREIADDVDTILLGCSYEDVEETSAVITVTEDVD